MDSSAEAQAKNRYTVQELCEILHEFYLLQEGSMKKRITALLLAIMMTSVFVLTACSGNNEMTDNTQPTATKASDETTAGEENKPTEPADPFGKYDPGITLRGAWVDTGGTVFVPGNPDYDSASQNVYIDAYKERLGISVEYDWVSADMDAYNTKWNLATAQQNLPDFVW
jgi:ABC-type glycerol-3-phosphate transport system substrate-binding protein